MKLKSQLSFIKSFKDVPNERWIKASCIIIPYIIYTNFIISYSEQLKLSLLKKKKCNSRALEIVESCLEPKIQADDFLDKVEIIDFSLYLIILLFYFTTFKLYYLFILTSILLNSLYDLFIIYFFYLYIWISIIIIFPIITVFWHSSAPF